MAAINKKNTAYAQNVLLFETAMTDKEDGIFTRLIEGEADLDRQQNQLTDLQQFKIIQKKKQLRWMMKSHNWEK